MKKIAEIEHIINHNPTDNPWLVKYDAFYNEIRTNKTTHYNGHRFTAFLNIEDSFGFKQFARVCEVCGFRWLCYSYYSESVRYCIFDDDIESCDERIIKAII